VLGEGVTIKWFRGQCLLKKVECNERTAWLMRELLQCMARQNACLLSMVSRSRGGGGRVFRQAERQEGCPFASACRNRHHSRQAGGPMEAKKVPTAATGKNAQTQSKYARRNKPYVPDARRLSMFISNTYRASLALSFSFSPPSSSSHHPLKR